MDSDQYRSQLQRLEREYDALFKIDPGTLTQDEYRARGCRLMMLTEQMAELRSRLGYQVLRNG